MFPLISVASKQKKQQKKQKKKQVWAGVREKCRDNVPEAPGFVFIISIMFIFL